MRHFPGDTPPDRQRDRNVVFNTDDVPQRLRREYWDDFMGRVYLRMCTQVPDPAAFFAAMESRQVGDVAVIKGAVGANSIDRPACSERASGVEQCLLFISLANQISFRHCDREVTLRDGDMTILDSRRPSKSITAHGSRTLFISLPRQALVRRFPSIEHVAGTTFAANSPLAGFSREYFKNLFEVASKLSPTQSSLFEGHALDMVSVLLSEAIEGKPAATAYRNVLRYRMKAFIQQSLHDPDLSVGVVAERFRVTTRYVAKLFSEENTTFTHYVRAKRLAECRRLLAMPSNALMQISQVAYSLGFRSQAHFNRLFRDAYDVTPSDYRAAAVSKE